MHLIVSSLLSVCSVGYMFICVLVFVVLYRLYVFDFMISNMIVAVFECATGPRWILPWESTFSGGVSGSCLQRGINLYVRIYVGILGGLFFTVQSKPTQGLYPKAFSANLAKHKKK